MRASNPTAFGCFIICLIVVGLLASIFGALFWSNLPLVPGNPHREQNLAMLSTAATAEVQAARQNAQPVCGGQVMQPGDMCNTYLCGGQVTNPSEDCLPQNDNILYPSDYNSRLQQAQDTAEANAKAAVGQRLYWTIWWATYAAIPSLLLCLILLFVFIRLLRQMISSMQSTIIFGPVNVSREGINYEGKLLPWSLISRVSHSPSWDKLYIRSAKDTQSDWATIEKGHIVDQRLFIETVQFKITIWRLINIPTRLWQKICRMFPWTF